MDWREFHKAENATPEKCLELVALAIKQVHEAFGAPGDFGYGTKEGQALQVIYAASFLVYETRKAMQPKPDVIAEGRPDGA